MLFQDKERRFLSTWWGIVKGGWVPCVPMVYRRSGTEKCAFLRSRERERKITTRYHETRTMGKCRREVTLARRRVVGDIGTHNTRRSPRTVVFTTCRPGIVSGVTTTNNGREYQRRQGIRREWAFVLEPGRFNASGVMFRLVSVVLRNWSKEYP